MNIRILHLVDLSDHAGAPALVCAAAVARLPGAHTVWSIGADRSALPGFSPARRFAARLGSPALSWLTLRRELARHRGAFDVVTCWSPGALAALHLASPSGSHPRVGVIVSGRPTEGSTLAGRLERSALARCTLLCFSDASGERWRAAGAGDVRIAPPFLALGTSQLPTREAARAALGIEPGEPALLLLAEPPSLGDARRFAYLAGLLSVGGAPCAALVHESNSQLRRGARFVRECGRLWRLVPCSDPIVSILPAADAAVVDTRVHRAHPLLYPPPGAEPEPTADSTLIALAAQLGVPVIMPRIRLAQELLAAGIPVVQAADTSCLSLASALFPYIDGTVRTTGHPGPPIGDHALSVLHELWREKLALPRPGFPLSLAGTPPPTTPQGALAPV